MTLYTAEQWPRGTVIRKDPFPQSGVRGTIQKQNAGPNLVGGVLTEKAKRAGVKPDDVIKKITTTNALGYTTTTWLNTRTGQSYTVNPFKIEPRPPRGQPITQSTFTKTNWIGLRLSGGQGTPIGMQLWIVSGTLINTEDASNAYIRRGGKFTENSGGEYFIPYSDMRGTSNRYAPRKLGLPYRNEGEQYLYAEELREKFGITANQLTAQGFDWVNGFYPAPPAEMSLYDLGYWTSSDSLVNAPLNFGGSGGGSGRGSRGRDSGIPATPNLPVPAVTITTRMPKGYAGRGEAISSRPQMVQRYLTNDDKHADDVFVFKYVPQGIKYSGLSGQWVEVPRAEDIPFVDWASWQLMKVSFSFIVADDRIEPGGASVPDGLEISIDGQIEKLRKMAQRKTPVTLVNFDEMLTFQLRRGVSGQTGTQIPQPNMEFVITDFSVTATRRTSIPQTGAPSTPSLIAVAQCEITLTEIPVETVGIIALPPITTPGLPTTTKKPPGGGPNSQRYEFITDIMASPDKAYNPYVPNDNT